MDPHMNPENLPEHLKPLPEDLVEDLTVQEPEELSAAIFEYRDVFSIGPDYMGCTDLFTHSIDTGDHCPIQLPPCHLFITKQYVEKADVQKMLDRGVIEPSQSSWVSPLVLVAGYWQVKMDQKDINKTAFMMRQGLFQFTVMPFSLCSTPATFEHLMELVLSGLSWKTCLICLDGVIMYEENFYDALDRLEQVWQCVREANLELKPSKFCLICDQVPFLGHYMSQEGIEVDPMKIVTIQDWPMPCTVKDVGAFLGLASYYRCYIPYFFSVATPLTGLMKKEAKLVWDDDCEQAFQMCSKRLWYNRLFWHT